MKQNLALNDISNYEAFAKYLGVDTEDFVNLQYGGEDGENIEFDEIEYEVPSTI
jgi:MoaA/NifB/PqqE/SkfB family radical SAM enzyme